MYHDHGENDRLDYTPQPAKLTAWQMLMIRLGVTRRNALEAKRPGKTAAEYAKAAADAIARVGRGQA
jgi:hypothetical protein